MQHEELLRLTKERNLAARLARGEKLGFPYIAVVKYSRQAKPIKYGMDNLEQAAAFAEAKETFNPYIRWTEVKPVNPLKS